MKKSDGLVAAAITVAAAISLIGAITTAPPQPSGAGGAFTTSQLGPTGCTNPAYSFQGFPTSGVCHDGSNTRLWSGHLGGGTIFGDFGGETGLFLQDNLAEVNLPSNGTLRWNGPGTNDYLDWDGSSGDTIRVFVDGALAMRWNSSNAIVPSDHVLDASGDTRVGRLQVSSVFRAPTAPSCTGLGTGSVIIQSASSDTAGKLVLSPTGAPAATGTCSFSFSGGWITAPVCISGTEDGTGAWLSTAEVKVTTVSTTAVTFQWDTNGAALTAGSTYRLNFACIGRSF